MLICFVLCAAAVLPTALSDKLEAPHIQQPVGVSNNELIRKLAAIVSSLRNQPQMQDQLAFTRSLRNGRDFDTLLGRSFGTSKRDLRGKRNFDEIDNAGFKDYLYKRNFDEIDNAGFRDNLKKRNFDEIDNAGFRDNLKRNFDEIDNAGFQDYLYKRNFDEIDNAGFSDYLSKKSFYENDNFGYKNSLFRKTPEMYYALLKELVKMCKTDKCKKKIDNFLSRLAIQKKNFDEIDNAGFRDYLYKRSLPVIENPTLAATA